MCTIVCQDIIITSFIGHWLISNSSATLLFNCNTHWRLIYCIRIRHNTIFYVDRFVFPFRRVFDYIKVANPLAYRDMKPASYMAYWYTSLHTHVAHDRIFPGAGNVGERVGGSGKGYSRAAAAAERVKVYARYRDKCSNFVRKHLKLVILPVASPLPLPPP